MKRIYYLLHILFLVTACEKVDLETYADRNYIQFVDSYKDSTALSFMFYPGKTTIDYPLEVKLLGLMENKDISYRLKVVKEETSAPANFYNIPEYQVLHEGCVTEVAKVQFIKQPEMDTKSFRIVVEVVSSDNALSGEPIYCRKIFWVSNLLTKPEWWDSNIEKYFLGAYSDRKFEEFIKIAETGDLTDKSPDERRVLCLKFKYYLQKRIDANDPVKEKDGSSMMVPIMG